MGRGGGGVRANAGELQKKKNSCKGKLSEKKIHACKVDQEKIPALAFHTFAQISGRQAGKHTVCKTSALWINFLLNFGLVNNHTWYKKNISEVCKLIHYRGAVTSNGTWHYYGGLWERHNKGQGLKKCAANVPSTPTGFLLSHCVYIASDLLLWLDIRYFMYP